jgi:SAM-dependent methyltransferase
MDARQMPFRDAFDVMGAFDVLEHIDDDDGVLREVHAALHAGGGLLLTVPQHRWLWSVQDVAAHHQRRYERSSLIAQLGRAGFRVVRATSFVSLLLPGMLLQRRLMDRGEATGGVEAVRVPAVLDRALRPFMAAERALVRVGIDIPVGGSLLVVAVREP